VRVRVYRVLLAVVLALGLTNCGDSSPVLNAVGSYSDVAILTDLDLFNPVAFQLKQALEVDANTGIRPESLLNVDIFDISSKDDARLYKNVIVIGYLKGQDRASKEIRRRLAGTQMRVLESRHLFFANNQNVLFLAGSDRSFMQSAINQEAPALRGQIEEKNRERVLEYLLTLGRNAEAERSLRENVGIRMTVPDGYRINGIKENQDGDLGMAEIVHENPTRGVVVFWKTLEDPAGFDMEDPEALLELRRRWGGFLDEALQDLYGYTWSTEMFRGETWPQLAGMYEVVEAQVGGPFRTLFLLDEPSRRVFGINWFTYNPRGDKHPYLREARAVAGTFVPRS
jgi:hypothetical protein